MHHQVRTPLERTAKPGGGHGIIDNQGHLGFLSYFSNRFKVHNHPPGIGQAFHKNGTCLFGNGGPECLGIIIIDKNRIPAEFPEALAHQIDGSPIKLIGDNHLHSRCHQRKQNQGFCSMSG